MKLWACAWSWAAYSILLCAGEGRLGCDVRIYNGIFVYVLRGARKHFDLQTNLSHCGSPSMQSVSLSAKVGTLLDLESTMPK